MTKLTAKNYCLFLLARREYSQKELFSKLTQKQYLKTDIENAIDELAEKNYQSDIRFAHQLALHRLKQGYGKLAISYELKQKGINVAVDLDDILLTVTNSWMTLLENVYLQKYQQESSLSRTEWAKRVRFLMQRGFSNAMINQLLINLEIKLS